MFTDKRQDYINNENIDYSNPTVLERPAYRHRRTALMITLADPKMAQEDIQKMMELGVNIIKFETSNCTKGERIKLLGKLDKAVSILCQKYAVLDWPITTCIELKTCIVRTGVVEGDNDVTLTEGDPVVLIYDLKLFDKCNSHVVFVDNPYISDDMKVGVTVSLGDDEIILRCVKMVDNTSVKCVVLKTGKLTNMALVTVKGGAKRARSLITKKDLKIVTFALEFKIDMIIINYARQHESIAKVKSFIGNNTKRPMLLAGLCTMEGLMNIDYIVKEADGIVLSREYLAYELEEASRYRLVNIQKFVNVKCQQAGKPFFLSGEIFKGALENGKFNDHDTTDVTNALLTGATGFVLKECNNIETLLEVITAMDGLCCCIEPLTNSKKNFWRIVDAVKIPTNAAEACAIACAALANQARTRIIIIPTVTGYTAKTLMWLRPAALVLTVSTKTWATRRLESYRCVVPLLFPGGNFKSWYSAVEARVQYAVEHAVKMGWLKLGDSYITLQRGTENSAYCDMVRIWRVTVTEKPRMDCADDNAKDNHPRLSIYPTA